MSLFAAGLLAALVMPPAHGILPDPVLTRGPYLQDATPTSIVVRWRTDIPTTSRVRFGPAPGGLVDVEELSSPTLEHAVALTGLAPATTYYYAVGSHDADLAGDDFDHLFETPPTAGPPVPFRAWVIGDSGLPGTNQQAVRDAYLASPGALDTDVWLMLGDNAYSTGTDAEYQAGLFDPYAAILRRTKLWTTRGNHDVLHVGPENDYYDLFTLPTAAEAGGYPSGTEAYYSFDFANAHFVCLDSEGSGRTPGSAMLTWLEADLTANAREWTIAFWHHPPYSKGSHDSDNESDSGRRLVDMREYALPILEAHGVDLVLGGHSHSYERSCLLDEHYGFSWTLNDSMKVDPGDGDPAGDGAYHKPPTGAHEGAVYAVAGSSAQISGGPLNHPVMIRSLNTLGSLILDVDGPRLAGRFLNASGQVVDRFEMVKDVPTSATEPEASDRFGFLAAAPNPFRSTLDLSVCVPAPGGASLTIVDVAGRCVARLGQRSLPAGIQRLRWDGLTTDGRAASPGVYFAKLQLAGDLRVRKLVLLR